MSDTNTENSQQIKRMKQMVAWIVSRQKETPEPVMGVAWGTMNHKLLAINHLRVASGARPPQAGVSHTSRRPEAMTVGTHFVAVPTELETEDSQQIKRIKQIMKRAVNS